MKKTTFTYSFVFVLFLAFVLGTNKTITVVSTHGAVQQRNVIIIDAGHGGEDGGAVSCTGVHESGVNLMYAIKLNDLLHLIGIDTCMIRTTDRSLSTTGSTISERKISDLKERVKLINATENGILVSIHQNYFIESKYYGAQVFYAQTDSSKIIAESLQADLIQTVNPKSHRKAKAASNIYIMEHIKCPGILIECGFLSNPQEEAKLLNNAYQNEVCSVIACYFSRCLNDDLFIA